MEQAHAELTDADRAILALPATKQMRATLAGFVAAYSVQVALLRGKVPSYVYDAAVALIESFNRWARDEHSL